MRKFLCTLAIVVALAAAASGQGGSTIKVRTVLHEDGTKTATTTDPIQRTSTAVTYDASDKVRQRVVYQLDENDLPVSGIIYDAKGQAAFKSTYKHDLSNRLSEQIDYTPNDKLLRRLVFEYGASNRISNVRTYDASGVELTPAKGSSGSGKKSRR